MLFHCPQKIIFTLFLDIKPCLPITHGKHYFKLHTPLERYNRHNFFEPGFGVVTYLDLGAKLFSTQWPLYGAIIVQSLLLILKGAFRTAPATPGLLLTFSKHPHSEY